MDAEAAAAGGLSALQAFWNQCRFSVGGADFLSIDVTLGAMVRGEWPAFERRLAQGLACVARANQESIVSFEDAVDEAATAFRYERDLISGADVDAWLHHAGLSSDDWTAYLTREVLRAQWAGEIDDVLERYPPTLRDLTAAVVAEGICSDAFATFERTLASHAALVFDRDPDAFSSDLHADTAASDERTIRLARVHADWLALRHPSDARSRLAFAVALEDRCAAHIERLAEPERLASILEINRLDWVGLDVETISFPTAAAAQEAIYCVKEDGMSLAEVAALSHQAVGRHRVIMDELGPDSRDILVAAEPHHVVGPLASSDGFDVVVVRARHVPTLANPGIAARARQGVIDAELQQAVRAHVTHARTRIE